MWSWSICTAPLNGLEVCRALNDYIPPIRVIILTAADDDDIRARALAAGAVVVRPQDANYERSAAGD